MIGMSITTTIMFGTALLGATAGVIPLFGIRARDGRVR